MSYQSILRIRFLALTHQTLHDLNPSSLILWMQVGEPKKAQMVDVHEHPVQ